LSFSWRSSLSSLLAYPYFFLFRLRKAKKEIEKEIIKMAYLKAWYKEIAVKIYGKDRIEEKEKEFLKNYNL